MPSSDALLFCIATLCCIFVVFAMITLATDLMGWTYWWTVKPYNDRQARIYARNRNNYL